MTVPKGNSKFCFPETLTHASLRPWLRKNYLLSRHWHINLSRFQDARPDHVRVESSSYCLPQKIVSFARPWELDCSLTHDTLSFNQKTHLSCEVQQSNFSLFSSFLFVFLAIKAANGHDDCAESLLHKEADALCRYVMQHCHLIIQNK